MGQVIHLTMTPQKAGAFVIFMHPVRGDPAIGPSLKDSGHGRWAKGSHYFDALIKINMHSRALTFEVKLIGVEDTGESVPN